MSVGSVLAETDIGNDEELGKGSPQQTDTFDHWSVRVVGCSPEGIFDVGTCRHAEEDDGPKSLGDEGSEMTLQLVDASAMHVRQGRNQGFFLGLIGDEKGIYKHRLGQLTFCLPFSC